MASPTSGRQRRLQESLFPGPEICIPLLPTSHWPETSLWPPSSCKGREDLGGETAGLGVDKADGSRCSLLTFLPCSRHHSVLLQSLCSLRCRGPGLAASKPHLGGLRRHESDPVLPHEVLFPELAWHKFSGAGCVPLWAHRDQVLLRTSRAGGAATGPSLL